MIGNILSLFIGLPYYCTICTYILTNFLPVRLNCLKIRTDQLQFSMNSALTIRMLLLLKSIWCISSIFCSVYLNYIEIFSLYKHFKKLLLSGWSCRRSYGWHHGYWWTQVKYTNYKIELYRQYTIHLYYTVYSIHPSSSKLLFWREQL